MTPAEKLKAIEDKYMNQTMMPETNWLIARVKKLEAQLKAMPSIMYLELLQTTAWMGIPEKKRESCIAEQVSNIEFIVNKALEGE